MDDHPVAFVFAVALVARVVVAVFMGRYFSGSFVLDDRTYWDMARDVANGATAGWTDYLHSLYASTLAFTWPLSLVYKMFGGAQISGQLFVALLGAGTAAGVVMLAKEALSIRLALFAGLVIALLPSQVLWSSLVLKDASVWFALVILAVLIARAARSGGWALTFLGIGIVLTLLGLAYLREHSAIVAAWALMLSGWVGQRTFRYQRIAGALVLGITVPWIAGFGPAGLTFVANAGSIEDRRAANAERAESAFAPGRERTATSALAQNRERATELIQKKTELAARATNLRKELAETEKEEPGRDERQRARDERQRAREERQRAREKRRLAVLAERLEELEAELAAAAREEKEAARELARIRGAEREPGIKHLARGVSVMIAEPYPWDAETSPSFRMAQAETLVWYPVLILALLGLFQALRALRVTLFPLLAGGAIMLVYALVEGNIGTAYRHRGEFVWVVALLAGFGVLQIQRFLRRGETSDPESR